MEPELLSNDDILHRIMALLGPRHVCIGIGATCHRLCDAAKSDTVCLDLEFSIFMVKLASFFRSLILRLYSNSVVERIRTNSVHDGCSR